MSINVEKIARLARLTLPENLEEGETSAKLQEDLERILHLAEQMSSIPTDHITLDQLMPSPGNTAMRTDQATSVTKASRERFQALAPETEAGLYLVPTVIDQPSETTK